MVFPRMVFPRMVFPRMVWWMVFPRMVFLWRGGSSRDVVTGGTQVGSWTESVRPNVMAGSCFRLRDSSHHRRDSSHLRRDLRDRVAHGSLHKATGQ